MGRRILTQAFSFKLIEGEGSQDNSYFYIERNELIIARMLKWKKPKYSIRVETKDEGGLRF